MVIGYYGEGYLTVQSGANVSVGNHALLGFDGDGLGEALVTGPGSLLSVGADLNLGGQPSAQGGHGALTVESGGAVDVTWETEFWSSTSSITVNGGTFETGTLTN